MKIMSILTMLCAIFSCKAQNKGFDIDVLKPDFEQKACEVLPKDKVIAVNCRSGKRSKKAAGILVRDGYVVVELDKGYNAWVDEGYKVVK